MMAEQVCLEGGRTTMGWLLTGLPEPDFGAIERSRQRRGIRPYTRMASASWLAANIAFIKDMDYMEARLRDHPKGDQKNEQDKARDKDKDKEKPKPKAKGKGGGKAAGAKTPAATETPE